MTAAVLLLLVVTIAQPVSAGTINGATWGWVTARQPKSSMYTPAAKDSGNWASQSNEVERLGAGDYRVTFPDLYNLAPSAGIPIVTAMSDSPRYCGLLDWGINSSSLEANALVRCFGYDGEAINTRFSIVYVRGSSNSGTTAYLLADQPGATDYTPDEDYNFNSSGGSNTVHRSSVGVYLAHLPNMSATAGNIQVSSVGDFTCKVGNKQAGIGELIANVNCYDPAGNPTDGRFLLQYLNGVGPTGVPRPSAAYLFANKPTKANYTPLLGSQYSSVSMNATVRRTSTGRYTATLNGMPKGGAAFVTALGTDKARCQLVSIRTDAAPQKVSVACYKVNGSPADSKFMLSYTK
jgi:hypothetical protein